MEGGRLEIPAPEALPGADKGWPGLGAYLDLLRACWAQAPQDRPTFAQVIAALRWARGAQESGAAGAAGA